MKKINDEKVVKFVKENTNYEIKTTSQNILNQYNYEKSLETQKPVKKNRFALAFGSIIGTLAIAGAAASAIFLFNPTTNPDVGPDIVFPDTNPSSNDVLKKQLITFSAFSAQGHENKGLKKRMFKQQENSIDEDEQNPTIVSELIKKSVDIYEEIETSVNYLYHESNIRTKTSEVQATFDKIDYTLVTKFYYSTNEEPFALYYFNEPNEKQEDDEIIRTSKAYYASGDQGYNVDVVEEVETEEDESEIETKLTFRDVHKVDNKVYVIEKENETENDDNQVSVENSLSFKTYLDESAYKSGNYLRKVSAETEVEGDESEIEVKVKTDVYKVDYKIDKISETKLNLLTTFEEKVGEEKNFEEETINLEYKETERTYTWKEFTWSFKK